MLWLIRFVGIFSFIGKWGSLGAIGLSMLWLGLGRILRLLDVSICRRCICKRKNLISRSLSIISNRQYPRLRKSLYLLFVNEHFLVYFNFTSLIYLLFNFNSSSIIIYLYTYILIFIIYY